MGNLEILLEKLPDDIKREMLDKLEHYDDEGMTVSEFIAMQQQISDVIRAKYPKIHKKLYKNPKRK